MKQQGLTADKNKSMSSADFAPKPDPTESQLSQQQQPQPRQ